MVIEPFQAWTPRRAQCPEIELAHERRVKHYAGYQGSGEQYSDYREEQHARQTQEHVGVQLQQKVHHAAVALRYHADLLSGRPVEGLDRHFGGGRIGARRGGDGHRGLIIVEGHEHRHFARTVGQRALHHLVQREQALRRARGTDAGHAELRLIFRQQVDLVMKYQRQTGDTEHQQESGADQTAPLVHQKPAPNRPSRQNDNPYCNRLSLAPIARRYPLQAGKVDRDSTLSFDICRTGQSALSDRNTMSSRPDQPIEGLWQGTGNLGPTVWNWHAKRAWDLYWPECPQFIIPAAHDIEGYRSHLR